MSYFAISYLGLILLLLQISPFARNFRLHFSGASQPPFGALPTVDPLSLFGAQISSFATFVASKPVRAQTASRPAIRLATGPELVAAHPAGLFEPVRLGDSRGKDRVKHIFPLSRSFPTQSEDKRGHQGGHTQPNYQRENNAINVANPSNIHRDIHTQDTGEQCPITRQLEVITPRSADHILKSEERKGKERRVR